ncbi:MAG: extracellular solute-binding protein [Prosthecobacter sp.]|nr:extracellular solute-binding protein [Prosthecobacter sp.]
MKTRTHDTFQVFSMLIAALFGISTLSAADFPPYDGTKERDAFWSFYNHKVLEGLQSQEKDLPEQIAKEADAAKKAELEAELTTVRERLKMPEYFTFAKPEDVPADLKWEDGMNEPEIGDPNAKKGGTMRLYILSFPPTLRILGENSNSSFRGYQADEVEMALLGSFGDTGLHPETGGFYPGIANQWAVSADNRTVYFRIDPEARYSDGVPVEVDDFFNRVYMELSEYPKNPFGNEYFATQFHNFTRYDARTMSVTLPEPKPLAPYFAGFSPYPRHFYSEFGPDFEQRYQWRSRPTTGPYVIHEEDINFGRSVTFTRVKDWWAKDHKFYRHRYNADRIVYRVVRLQEKVLELFRQGELDAEELMMGIPEYWYEKLEIPEVHKGYINKAKFYRVWPSSYAGLWLNTAVPPLNNKEVRLGLSFATNYQKVIDFDLRGDFQRLNAFAQGYTLLGNPPIQSRPFDVQKAREHFAQAGYTKLGNDGVLMNDKGQRLSVTILHRKVELIQKVMQRLKEEAIKAGLEYKLEGMDTTAYFQKATQKKHQAVSVAFGTSPPLPDHFQYFHSKQAYMDDGKTPKTNTNNLTSFADPRMDKLSDEERHATSIEEFRAKSHACDQIIHDEAIWIPGYEQNYYRVAYWRWVKWPEKTFNLPISDLPLQYHVHWIDEEVKRETEAAIRSGKTFPETDQVFDHNLKSGGTK